MTKKLELPLEGELTASVKDLLKLAESLREQLNDEKKRRIYPKGFDADKQKWCIRIRNKTGHSDDWEIDPKMMR